MTTQGGQVNNKTPNPLIDNQGLPNYDQIKAEHVAPAIKHMLTLINEKFSALEASCTPSWSELLEPLEEISLIFQRIWSPVVHLNSVKNSEDLRKAYESVQSEVIATALKMSQSEKIYQTLKELKEAPEWTQLNNAQQRIIDARLTDAQLSGIALQGEQKETFNALTQELSQLSTKFANNVLDSTKSYQLTLNDKSEVKGLSKSYLNMAAQSYNSRQKPKTLATADTGPWCITLDAPSFIPFMENCQCRALRESIYRAYVTRASKGEFDNSDNITRILQIRKEKAKLLGYNTYAEISLAKKMAPSIQSIFELEEELRQASWEPAKKELADLEDIAKRNGVHEPLLNWDISFWAKRLQEERFEFSDEDLKPYFPLHQVLDGLFKIVHTLFGITVKRSEQNISLWHDDVMFYDIYDEDQSHIASFFLDPYSRPENKRGGAWMDECVTRRVNRGKLSIPVAYLVCNSTPPVDSLPSLLTFRDVETLFHEFGHGLQHMLTTVDFLDASGINGIEWDAVELPSQFMENWCYHKETLFSMAKHYKTGESIPTELFDKVVAAKTFRAGQIMLRQIQFGLIDLKLHHEFDPYGKKSPFEVQSEVSKTTSVLPPLQEDRFLCSFSHIFSGGYAAGYYSYKWAEILSADAFSAFEDNGLDNEDNLKKTGHRFRNTILSKGGSEHPMEVFKEFRGREPSTKALLAHNGLS